MIRPAGCPVLLRLGVVLVTVCWLFAPAASVPVAAQSTVCSFVLGFATMR
jgi:hypothetical protein